MTEQVRNRLAGAIVDASRNFEARSPLDIIRFPTKLMVLLADGFFGERLLSWSALARASLLNVLISLAALSVVGWKIGTPFAIPAEPWQFSQEAATRMESTPQDPKSTLESEAFTLRGIELVRWVTAPPIKWVYGAGIICLAAALCGLLGCTVLAIARATARAALEADSAILVLAAFCVNLFTAFVLGNVVLLVLVIATQPFLWLTLRIVLLIPSGPAIIVAPVITLLLTALWSYGTVWIRVLALTSVWPAVAMLTIAVLFSVAYPFQKELHTMLAMPLRFISRTGRPVELVVWFLSITGMAGVVLLASLRDWGTAVK